MSAPRIVVDTNVLVAALRSRRGTSFKLVSLMGLGKYEIALSVALVLEYEDVLNRQIEDKPLTSQDVSDFLDYLCRVGHKQAIFYLWRPVLQDSNDDMLLELAVAAGCRTIVTHNVRDFNGSLQFGVEAVTPREFLKRIGVKA